MPYSLEHKTCDVCGADYEVAWGDGCSACRSRKIEAEFTVGETYVIDAEPGTQVSALNGLHVILLALHKNDNERFNGIARVQFETPRCGRCGHCSKCRDVSWDDKLLGRGEDITDIGTVALKKTEGAAESPKVVHYGNDRPLCSSRLGEDELSYDIKTVTCQDCVNGYHAEV